MPKLLHLTYFIFLCSFCHAQFKTISIYKNEKLKLTYKQGQVITISTKQNDTISGVIYLIDEEYIYLNQDKEVAIKDITVIHPFFKPNFGFYKPKNAKEWVEILLISFAITIVGDPRDIYLLWTENNQQQAQLTRKQRRLNQKQWAIGNKYKLRVL